MSVRLTARLGSVFAVDIGPDGAVLRHPWGATSVRGLPELYDVLDALRGADLDAATMAGLIAGDREFDDVRVMAGLAQLDGVLSRLPMLITRSVLDGSGTLVSVEPISDRATGLEIGAWPDSAALWLDRFTYLRRRPQAPGLCLESPLALHRAYLGPALLTLIGRMASDAVPVGEIHDVGELAAVGLLVAAGLVQAGTPGTPEEESLATWSFHDLTFHAGSRPGRSDALFGAHFLHRDRFPALPAVPPSRTGPTVDLPRPSFADVIAGERSLTEVIESRRSVRHYGGEPLTVAQLGELLYRSARTRQTVPVRSDGYDGADHPYPTGGLAGDLEVYVVVAACAGIAPGVYHYESAAHRLRLINEIEAASTMVDAARTATGQEIVPQVLLVITSRFARTAWKYEMIAYALTLKHVGALMQTVYLVATSMGLAPCAIGSGDADRAARVFGLDWLVESSVGEMAIGSVAEPSKWVNGFTDVVARYRAR